MFLVLARKLTGYVTAEVILLQFIYMLIVTSLRNINLLRESATFFLLTLYKTFNILLGILFEYDSF